MSGRLPVELQRRIDDALARRAALLNDPHTDVGRLLNGAADNIPGLIVERFGGVLIVQLHEGHLRLPLATVRGLCDTLREAVGATAVYRKVFPRDRSHSAAELTEQHSDPTPWLGKAAAPEIIVHEHGLKFAVRPYDGYLTGLFLDHRANRQRIQAMARGKRVLNAFAYTCGYALAALAGGAEHVTNVDVSRKALEWGRRNAALNNLPDGQAQYICSDIFDYYRRAARQKRNFDLVILDPPTFARARKPARVFQIEEDLPRLVAGALELMTRASQLLLCTNHRGTNVRRLSETVQRAAERVRRRATVAARPRLPLDFRGDPGHACSVLVDVD